MSKPVLILLHGAIGAKEQLEPMKAILDKDFEVHTLNFSGHGGRAYKPGEFTINTFVGDVLDYMDEQGIEQTYLFGYSMGGFTSLNLARQHPERVVKLFTLATKLRWTPESAAQEMRNLNADKIEEKVPKFAELLKQRHAPNDWKELVSKTALLLEGIGNGLKLYAEDYQQMEVPITIGVGTEDTLVSVEESEHTAGLLPNGNLKVFEGFKHPIEQIDVEELCAEIRQFFLD